MAHQSRSKYNNANAGGNHREHPKCLRFVNEVEHVQHENANVVDKIIVHP